jgi:hypothetical protein
MSEFLTPVYSQELLSRAERTNNYPTELLDSLTAHAPPGYEISSAEAFVDSVIDDIMESPEANHLIVAGGDSGNGKSVTLQELIVEVARNNKPLKNRLKKLRYDIVVAELPWGKAKARYVTAGSLRDAKLVETNSRQVSMHLGLRSWATARRNNAVKLAYMDMPIITGTVVNDDEAPIGIPRGESLVKDIFNPKGPFSNVAMRAHFFGISASPDVRDHAMTNRAIAMQELPLEVILDQLAKRGFDPGTANEAAIREYFAEVAPPDQMRLVYQDINEVITGLIARGLLEDPSMRDIDLMGSHPYFQHARHNFIVHEIFPYFMNKMAIPKNRGVIFSNEKVQEMVHAYVDVATEMPLEEPM